MEIKQTDTERYTNKIITIPNLLSLFRLLLIPVIVWLYCVAKEPLFTGYVLILSGLTDIVDGFIARRFHMISNVGKVLDPIADKLTQAAMLFCLLFRFPLIWCPLLLLIIKELFMGISGLLIIKRTGKVLGAHWHGKAATCLLYAMMILHTFWYNIPSLVSDSFILACAGMIVLSLVLYAIRNIRELQKPLPYGTLRSGHHF